MGDRISEFRAAVHALGGPGRGKRYPRELRGLAIRCWEEGRRSGQSVSAVASALGVSRVTLERWLDTPALTPRSGELCEVVLRDSPSGSGLVLCAPGGYRVEGLSVSDAATLLGLLR